MDDAKARSAFGVLFVGFLIYALSALSLWALPEPYAFPVSTTLLLLALVVGVVGVFAIKRGWRLGRSAPRSAKRRKEREKGVSPWTRR